MVDSSRREFLQASGLVGVGAASGVAGARSDREADEFQAGDETWPTFQYDAQHTGHATDNTGPVENVGEKWRSSGEDYDHFGSPPTVADGTVYKTRTNGLAAYDAESGTEQWHVEFQAGKGAPTVSDGTVYVGGEFGFLHAFDAADGTEQWRFDTYRSNGEQKRSEVGNPNRLNMTPAVADGTVYVGSGETPKTVYAVDAESGSEQWRFQVDKRVYTDPAVKDGTVYVSTGPYLYALDAASGTQQWRYATGDVGGSPPTVVDGTVYVGGNFKHHAVDAASGEKLWTAGTEAAPGSGQAVANGTVYAASSKGLFALSAETGEKQWDEKWRVPGGAGPPVVVGDTVYFVRGTASGENPNPTRLYGLDAATGEELWSVVPENREGNPAALAVANSTVYTRLGVGLYAFEGDAPKPDPETTTTVTDETTTGGQADASGGGGLPLVPIAGGVGGLGVLGLLLLLFRRRDDEDEER